MLLRLKYTARIHRQRSVVIRAIYIKCVRSTGVRRIHLRTIFYEDRQRCMHTLNEDAAQPLRGRKRVRLTCV